MRIWSLWFLSLALTLAQPGCNDTLPCLDLAVQPVDNTNRFLVNPRWTADGQQLILAGYQGVGSFCLDPSTGHIDECGAAAVELHPVRAPDGTSGIPVAGARVIKYDEYWGRLSVIDGDSERELVEHAWGARVSPTGDRVAFCTGHLYAAWLHVMTLDGKAEYSGPGAQPAWLPGGQRLVFSLPSGGPAGIDDSDLFLLDLASGNTLRMTATPEITEMQPAVSPCGRRLAWVDWRSGKPFVARLDLPGGGA